MIIQWFKQTVAREREKVNKSPHNQEAVPINIVTEPRFEG